MKETGKKMKTRHYLGDAMTAVSVNIIFNITSLLSYFYTDIIGMSVGVISIMLLISKFADAFTDIGMGYLVDRTKSRYGKARPWLIRMAIPSFICIVLLFLIPANAGVNLKAAYALATNLLVNSIIYTAISIPAGSLLSLETSNPHERAKMGIWRLVFAYAAGMAVSSFMIPATNKLGGAQNAWVLVSAVFGVISAVSLVIAFYNIKENNDISPGTKEKAHAPLKAVSFLFQNKYWIIVLFVNILIQAIYALGTYDVYYAKYIFGDENLVGIMGLISLIFVVIGFVYTGLLVGKLGKRNLVMVGMVISIVGYVMRAAAPYHLPVNLIGKGLGTLGGIPILAVIGALLADTIEYGEWKTGSRTVGIASSANSFGSKLGAGLSIGLAGWLLAFSGYNGNLAAQPPMAERMIQIVNIYIPLIGYILIFILMFFYKLDKDYGRIMAELEERHNTMLLNEKKD